MMALRTNSAAAAVLLYLTLCAGCSGDSTKPSHGSGAGRATASGSGGGGEPWFEDRAAALGIEFQHRVGKQRRYHFPEIVGGGAALFDAEGDGDLDAYLVQSGDLLGELDLGNELYVNEGARFRPAGAAAGVDDRGYGMGVAVGDADGDGDLDLYVTNLGPNVFFANRGELSFEDVTATAGVQASGWSTSAGFQDFDRDGDLDLFVVEYIRWSVEKELGCPSAYSDKDYCSPNNYNTPAPDRLFDNQGDGTFVEVSESAGIGASFGNGLGVSFGDFDADGWTDVYVANDGMPNQLWRNLGDGRFEDRALVFGCAVNMQGSPEAGMGVASVDLDDDGDLDLFMTHLRGETNTYYQNVGGRFVDASVRTGLSGPSVSYTGFGFVFGDFDHDGSRDLYVGNGRVGHWRPAFSETDPFAEPDQLYRGLEGRFQALELAGGVANAPVKTSRGIATGDLDGDGDLDLLLCDSHSAARVLINVAQKAGGWIGFDVKDERGAEALGARVALEAGGSTRWRQVQRAFSYCASSAARVHFGVPTGASVEAVRVRWADGEIERFGSRTPGTVHVLRRGTGE